MAKQSTSRMKQAGVTPAKLGLICVLAVVLATVLYIQFAPPSAPETPVAPATPPTARMAFSANRPNRTAQNATSADTPFKKTGTVANWLAPNLKSVVKYDPFALPAAFPRPKSAEDEVAQAVEKQDDTARLAQLAAARAQAESELQQLRAQGVSVIITRDQKQAALIGDQIVHVGDEISGFRVVAIEGDDVRLEKDLTP